MWLFSVFGDIKKSRIVGVRNESRPVTVNGGEKWNKGKKNQGHNLGERKIANR